MLDTELKELGNLMQLARKAKKRTQEEIAKIIGVSKNTVSEWERGEMHPGFLNVKKYCEILEISIDDMLCVKKNACSLC
jgi:transcriptional regulator with XRE-family HTH domain